MKHSFSVTEALQFGFRETVDHFILFFEVIATGLLVEFVRFGGIVLIIALNFVQSFGFDQPGFAITKETLATLFSVKVVTVTFLVYLLFKLVISAYSLGFTKITLEIYDRDKSSYAVLYSCINLVIKHVIASLLYITLVGVGLLFFVIPGIYFWIKFYFYQHAIADKGYGPLEAFRYSAELTENNKLHLAGLFAVLYILTGAATALYGIGLLIMVPMSLLAGTYAYRSLQK